MSLEEILYKLEQNKMERSNMKGFFKRIFCFFGRHDFKYLGANILQCTICGEITAEFKLEKYGRIISEIIISDEVN